MNPKKLGFVCLALASLHTTAALAEQVKEDRYLLITPSATESEKDPLSVNISVDFPPNVFSVGDAVRFVMVNSGYVFATPESNDDALNIMLSRPLPAVHRKMDLLPLRDVLQVLVGDYFVPVEDPIRRIYTFDVKEEFKGLVDHE